MYTGCIWYILWVNLGLTRAYQGFTKGMPGGMEGMSSMYPGYTEGVSRVYAGCIKCESRALRTTRLLTNYHDPGHCYHAYMNSTTRTLYYIDAYIITYIVTIYTV